MIEDSSIEYSTETLIKLKKSYNLKCCYRDKISFLKLQDKTSHNLSNRITSNSNFLYSFKQINYYYIKFLRENFLISKNNFFIIDKKNCKNFLEAYKSFYAMKDFNRALIWRASKINPMFKTLFIIKKKKKKIVRSTNIVYIPEKKRILLVWTWLKFFIKSTKNKKLKLINNFHAPLSNFLTQSPENHVLENIKLKIYRIQLFRTL